MSSLSTNVLTKLDQRWSWMISKQEILHKWAFVFSFVDIYFSFQIACVIAKSRDFRNIDFLLNIIPFHSSNHANNIEPELMFRYYKKPELHNGESSRASHARTTNRSTQLDNCLWLAVTRPVTIRQQWIQSLSSWSDLISDLKSGPGS